MSIDNPVGGAPKDPYEEYKRQVEAVEREAREKGKKSEPPNESTLLLAQVLAWMRKVLDLFTKIPSGTEIGQDVRENLQLLKASFEILKIEDRSQDVEFLNALSIIWNKTLENSLHYKKGSTFSSSLKSFLKEIQTYPKEKEHTLGYYLTEYTGQKWLPFPYMELIQKIHREHANGPQASILTQWTAKIDHLIAALAE